MKQSTKNWINGRQQAAALEAQLELNKTDVIKRVEEQKGKLEQIAQNVRDKIDAAGGYAEEAKARIRTSFEQLQVQLALGAADTRDAYQDWKQKLQSSTVAFEADLELAAAYKLGTFESELNEGATN